MGSRRNIASGGVTGGMTAHLAQRFSTPSTLTRTGWGKIQIFQILYRFLNNMMFLHTLQVVNDIQFNISAFVRNKIRSNISRTVNMIGSRIYIFWMNEQAYKAFYITLWIYNIWYKFIGVPKSHRYTLLVLQEYKICFIKKETDRRITESGYHKEVKKLSRVSFDGISRSEIYNGILYFKREVKVCWSSRI